MYLCGGSGAVECGRRKVNWGGVKRRTLKREGAAPGKASLGNEGWPPLLALSARIAVIVAVHSVYMANLAQFDLRTKGREARVRALLEDLTDYHKGIYPHNRLALAVW